MHVMKPTGARRLILASRNSWHGLVDTFRSEAAFRQEIVLAIVAIALIFALDLTAFARAVLVATLGLILITELLNTGIEAVVDRVGPEWHALSKKAKDAGSAAVTVSLVVHGATWAIVL